MSGKWKTMILAFALLSAAASAATAASTRVRAVPTGPEWYLDENGRWHSIRDDWPGIQRPMRGTRRERPPDYGQSAGEQ
jgi:hypothetical protein